MIQAVYKAKEKLQSHVPAANIKELFATHTASSPTSYVVEDRIYAQPSKSADISLFGWEIKDDTQVPVVAKDDPIPPELSDVIRCQRKIQTNKCGSQTVVATKHTSTAGHIVIA